jgi:hypothetical protein
MACKSQSFQFYANEDKTLELELKVSVNDCKEIYALESTDEIKVILPARPADLEFLNTGATPRVSITSEPYGQIKIDLVAAETSQLIDGAIVIEVVRASKRKIFVVDGGLKKLTPNNC